MRTWIRLLKLLSIDTSTEACSVALLSDGKVYEQYRMAPRQHSQIILPMIESVLADCGNVLADVDAIAFGRGPGSFMGVRTAAGVVQGIALARDLPVVAISTLASIAQSYSDEQGEMNMLVAIDARMSEVYWAMYSTQETGLVELAGIEQVMAPEQVTVPDQAEWAGVGSGWLSYSDELSACCTHRLKSISGERYPHAASIAKLAEPQVLRGDVVSAEQALPVYIRDNVAKKSVIGSSP